MEKMYTVWYITHESGDWKKIHVEAASKKAALYVVFKDDNIRIYIYKIMGVMLKEQADMLAQ